MTIPLRLGPTQPTFSKHSSNLSAYMPKGVGDKGQPYLTPILQLISFDQPSLFLNLAITFSYILIATTLNSRGTFIYSILFKSFFQGTMTKDFLKSTKQQGRLVLVLRNSFEMMLTVTIWSTVE